MFGSAFTKKWFNKIVNSTYFINALTSSTYFIDKLFGIFSTRQSYIRLTNVSKSGLEVRFATVLEDRNSSYAFDVSEINLGKLKTKKAGTYSINYRHQHINAGQISISRNDVVLPTGASEDILIWETPQTSQESALSWTGYLKENEIIRVNTSRDIAGGLESTHHFLTATYMGVEY